MDDKTVCSQCNRDMKKLSENALMLDSPIFFWCQGCGAVAKVELESTAFGRTRRTWMLPDSKCDEKQQSIQPELPKLNALSAATLLAHLIKGDNSMVTVEHVQELIEKAIDERLKK